MQITNLSGVKVAGLKRKLGEAPQPPAGRIRTTHTAATTAQAGPPVVLPPSSGTTEPDLRPIACKVPPSSRRVGFTALTRLLHSSWEDAPFLCKRIEGGIFDAAASGSDYVARIELLISRLRRDPPGPPSETYLGEALKMRMKQRVDFSEPFFSYLGLSEIAKRRRALSDIRSAIGDEELAWKLEHWSWGKSTDAEGWRVCGLKALRPGAPIHYNILTALPANLKDQLKASLARGDEEVEVVGERSWAERDAELRSRAVVLE